MDIVAPVAITVPVTDFDRALGLYRSCLGFSTLADRGSAPRREVTMLAPGGVVAIQLVEGTDERPAGSLREAVLPVRDLASTLGCLRWAGFTEHWVDLDAPGGPAALFTDADGNTWTIWQPADAVMRAA